ncbi:MAG TPA: cysteine desulfurase family protein, partial [Aggregicoccus sp.]|nr:cysteine desulfurase family protein [Aggregicoccus sp.]
MIYWDHNAATPLRPEVAELLARTLAAGLPAANPSSTHRQGRAARARLDAARARVARSLGCEPREVCFTASGSESAALALKGAFLARARPERRRIVTSSIEHPALLAALAQLEPAGAELVRVPPGPDGRVDPRQLQEALGPDTALCSLMWANNETGVLQPARELAQACRQQGIPFHTDAVQAAGKVPLSFREVDADLLSLSGHKLGGPPGVGLLVVRGALPLQPLTPGHQEGGRRGGTPNLPFIEALALALELAQAGQPAHAAHVARLRDRFEQELLAQLPGVRVNGAGAPRVPNTSNLHFEGADGEALLIALDLEGISASAGAACASGSLAASHVLRAQG